MAVIRTHRGDCDGYNRLLVDQQLTWTEVSDCALLARFHGLSPADNQAAVVRTFNAISDRSIPGIINLHPAFASLLVIYNPLVWTPMALVQKLVETNRADLLNVALHEPVSIPACFVGGFAPDLSTVATRAGLNLDETVSRFITATYHVAFLGFAPGFPYLLGLPPELATPRLPRPRTHLPAGSIAIAGEQTGIYPSETPGGWQIIGRIPVRLFDPEREPMSLLLPGDEVRFVRISEQRFEELSQW